MANGFWPRLRRLSIIAMLASVVGLGISPVTASASLSSARLNGVSCPSTGACTAVGTFINSSNIDAPLAERWNGTKWTFQSTPNPAAATSSDLFGVSCTDADACTAVGGSNALPSGGILAERWNGTNWHIQSTPNPAGSSILTGVSCPGGHDCTAVGLSENNGIVRSLAEHWDGTAWHIQSTPNPAGTPSSQLVDVSCRATDACTAVGFYFNGTTNVAMSQLWNGTAWHLQSVPQASGATKSRLLGVSCPTAVDCEAGGDSDELSLAERSNGTSWTIQATPNPAGATLSVLAGMSCSSAAACTMVGSSNALLPDTTLAERWNGTSWTIESTPNAAGTTSSFLSAVSCSAATACTAVGVDFKGGISFTLAERWNGSSWRIQSTP